MEDRGRHDASQMGKRLRKAGMKPDLLLSSPAVRAVTTAQKIAKELHYERDSIVIDERLYPGDADQLLGIIRTLDDKLQRVMLVAHNPALTELAYRFSKEITHLKTCAIATFSFDTDAWKHIDWLKPVNSTVDVPTKS